MKFKLDENLPELIHTTLVGLGHDARTVAEEQLAGATDDAVLRASIAERRVFITLDLDFADIRAYPGSCGSSMRSASESATLRFSEQRSADLLALPCRRGIVRARAKGLA